MRFRQCLSGSAPEVDPEQCVHGVDVDRGRRAAGVGAQEAGAGTTPLLAALRTALADDLDTPRAIRTVDDHVAAGRPATAVDVDAVDALLGIDLRR